MKYKIIEITTVSMAMITTLNFFICIATELRYIEFIYLLLFLGINLYIIGVKAYSKIETYNYNPYTIRKKILNSKRILFLGSNILIFFYIYKEPYFYLSKNKVLILLSGIIVEYLTMIFLHRIKMRFSFNLFKGIVKIFIISGIIYHFPLICVYLIF